MSSPKKNTPEVTESEALEIIEMTSNDLDCLARAFNIIEEVVEAVFTDHDEDQETESYIH